MTYLARSTILLLLFLAACTLHKTTPPHEQVSVLSSEDITKLETGFVLWQPCTPAQAERWLSAAAEDDRQALQAASCCAYLLQQSEDKAVQSEYARQGYKLAESVLHRAPQSGLVNYLAACLEGLKAERSDPLDALQAVPEIERKALTAARLAPRLDDGGPDRLLGELYLRAPEPPVSIGDSSKAVSHFRKAVQHAPRRLENRLGLAAALLAEGELGEACDELNAVLLEMPPEDRHRGLWKKTMGLLKTLCEKQLES